MANSITASTVSPFTGLLLTDSNFITTASFGGSATTASTPSLAFANIDYPTVGKFIVQVAATNTTVGTGSVNVVLQESNDNTTWNNIAVFANPIFVSSGSVPGSVQVLLTPQAKTYLRAQAQTLTGNNATGSITLSALF